MYRCATFFVSEVYYATIRPPSIGLFLSMHLSVHISSTMGMIAWKNARKASVLVFIFVAVLSFAAFLFLFLFTQAYLRGCFSFLLFIYAFCCNFHCLESFPLSKLSHPITTCSSISRLYVSISGCPQILSILIDTDSPLKYGINPSLSISQSFGSTVFSKRLICFRTFLRRLLLYSH